MSGGTYVVVTDDRWRFDPEAVFAALAQAYAGLPVKRQGNTMNAYAWSRGWEITVLDDHTTFIISAPATPMIELVAWMRGQRHDRVWIVADEFAGNPPRATGLPSCERGS